MDSTLRLLLAVYLPQGLSLTARFSAVMWPISASQEPLDSHGTCYMICWLLLESR
jgi:hypothetical protein